ncbi:type II toxin-antitoxin system RelB/DinJ family antitoxin [Mycoplasma mycoides subsp. capri]|uniref:type II toxin-antitoxin system RelB/DinJ family antitoxin n=1 Tax=Mycoplasma mycoides TaxID=2102 RepID=UPI002240ADCA|nr:type II toxin-antitoxin system RelB/DinJ family antitoxin [Mycoplasma mycoides]QVJ96181.1 type II toxin-antitoxin system RelB/DinJ family antitoxin [Mycoplasma mycoides subsp. capri]QVJ97075.1 type II toxin-antitoxin system RelB/DinJ family antitoxin [Mycoplasma mycoides subsp. capri]QVK00057.1 type II toxin-antitoxin system RelB/DinJ family antitoxin [Mycoplasma mycoides subsp. capri]QVK00939.1 type II toxin-antitoxin system RelB/DinJ family antitoxin [Mycoplasma mycoides subsp. capri]
MKTTNVNIKMDPEIKKQASLLFKEFGMTMSSAINLFVKTAVEQNDIPFEYNREITNKETLEAFEEGERLLADKNAKRYSSFKEILDSLDD